MELLTIKGVADKYHVSTRTVHRWIYRENEPLPAQLVGHTYMIESKALEAWADSNLVEIAGKVQHRNARHTYTEAEG